MSATGKNRLRNVMQERRKRDDLHTRQRESGRIQRSIMDLAPVSDATTLCGYLPLEWEVQINKLLDLWVLADRPVVVPAFDTGADGYRWARYTTAGPWCRGRFGVTEPATPDWQEPDEQAAVLVPGLAFDRRGQRLGHGMGFYDRLLTDFTGAKVGLAFSYQWVDRVPSEPHDVAMDWVVTELECHRCAPADSAAENSTDTKALS